MARPADGLRAERPDLRGRRADGGAVAASSNRRPGEDFWLGPPAVPVYRFFFGGGLPH